MQQFTATLGWKVRNGRALARALKTVDPAMFSGLGIHFARLVHIDEPLAGAFDAWLVFETNFDSAESSRDDATRDHLERVHAQLGSELAKLFVHCEVDAERALLDPRARWTSTAEYQGHPHRELTRIDLERRVHHEVRACVSGLPKELSDEALHAAVRAKIQALDLVDLDAPPPSLPDPDVRANLLAHRIKPWVTHAPKLLPALPLIAISSVKELFDEHYDMQVEAAARGPDREAQLLANAASEDHLPQNALTHLVALKPGFVRRMTLRAVHRFLSALAVDYFDQVEMLGGIPSIHFAKWLLIDGGRRLLFFSNYDGSWESYLGDFVDGAAIGLNLAWSCTEGYPRTVVLANGGADDEQRFKAWARAHQRPTEVFYAAYPDSTVTNVNNATWVRYGLHAKKPDSTALAEWRRRLT